MVKSKHKASAASLRKEDLILLPPRWTVIAITVTLTILAIMWYYILSGLLFVSPGSIMTTKIDVLFNLDTSIWFDKLCGLERAGWNFAHPLMPVYWFTGRALLRIFECLSPHNAAPILLGRILNALVAGLGSGCMALIAINSGLGVRRLLILMPAFFCFTSSVVIAPPEHFGLSYGLLAISFAVYVSKISPAKKVLALRIMTVLVTGLTITNGLLPILCLLSVMYDEHGQYFKKSETVRYLLGAAFLLGSAAAMLATCMLWERVQTSVANYSAFLHLRLFNSPGQASVYALHALLDPAIGPTPHDVSAYGHVTYEPVEVFRYDWIQAVAVGAWMTILIPSIIVGLRMHTARRYILILTVWVVFNLTFHNIWGNEFFLFSPHWSWALMTIVLFGGRVFPVGLLLVLTTATFVGQIHSLILIRHALSAVVGVG